MVWGDSSPLPPLSYLSLSLSLALARVLPLLLVLALALSLFVGPLALDGDRGLEDTGIKGDKLSTMLQISPLVQTVYFLSTNNQVHLEPANEVYYFLVPDRAPTVL